MESSPPTPPVPCPHCGRPSAAAFDATGICRTCAGARLLAQVLADRPGSAPPFPPAEGTVLPDRIGPFHLISELGRGGMGAVYLAQHTQLGRIVALKVIRSDRGAVSELEMRFLREARTLARLHHPHIVAVHDAGRDQGQAWYAMDYFEDGDLARRLRAQPFAPREAATLLLRVAEAIACSHAAGIVHRDLKPSNILLAGGSPHVADFGLASELDQTGGLTAGTSVLGTPHYLAPEALRRGSAALGVASDVYALGVILHEMLAGRTPFAGAAPAELPALLERHDAPDLRLIAPHVPRDLALITGKCLEFEPSRRYATATALAGDLRSFLAGEPVGVRPMSVSSRLSRWTRRHPALAGVWVLSTLLAAGSLLAAFRINRERLRANTEASASRALADFLGQDVLQQSSPFGEPDRDLKLRTALDRSLEKFPRRFAEAPLAEATVRFILGHTYRDLGEYEQAERQFRRAAALRQRHLGPSHPETLQAVVEVAATLNSLGRHAEAAALIRPAAAELARLHGAAHVLTLGALQTQALVEWRLGYVAKAEALLRATLATARRTHGPGHALTIGILAHHATLLESQGKAAEAVVLSREAVALLTPSAGPLHLQTLGARVDVAVLDAQLGRAVEAAATLQELIALLRTQFGPDHPETLRAQGNLGTVLSRLGRYAEAEAAFTDLAGTRRRVLGPDHPSTLLALKHLVLARGRNGHLEDAIALMRELVATSTRVFGPEHVTTLNYLRNLSGMLMSARRFDDAVPPAQTAHTASLRKFGPDEKETVADADTLASALTLADRHDEAEPIWRQLVDSLARTQPDHWRSHYARGQLGKTLARIGDAAEAEPLLRESFTALHARRSELPANRQDVPRSLAAQLATVCTTLGRPDEAAEWQRKADAR